MPGEPLELLIDVEPLQQQRELLLEALLVDLAPSSASRSSRRVRMRACTSGSRARTPATSACERGAALLEQLTQPLALAGARRHEFAPAWRANSALGRLLQLVSAVGTVLAQHARASAARRVRSPCPGSGSARCSHVHRASSRSSAAGVHFERAALRLAAALADGAVDLAPAQLVA